jgi:site-specific DNA-methyltransferase (adenine-specific)
MLALGEIWEDPIKGHRVGCLDATNPEHVAPLMGKRKAALAVQDPPYNQVAFEQMPIDEYIAWSSRWVDNCLWAMAEDASLYVWLGADQNNGFQPLPDFMLMMRGKPVKSRSFITMRNQRGYGTQKNWMCVRQECLYYIRGNPPFTPQYTDIPRKTNGYYKEVGGKLTENRERSKSPFLRAGNVWIDVQQIFYKLEEDVKGCYAQKPLKAIERIVLASSRESDLVIDFFAHAGTTLLACERLNRVCYMADVDPRFCEVTIRRLLNYRKTGKTGGDFLSDEEDNSQSDSPQLRLFAAAEE